MSIACWATIFLRRAFSSSNCLTRLTWLTPIAPYLDFQRCTVASDTPYLRHVSATDWPARIYPKILTICSSLYLLSSHDWILRYSSILFGPSHSTWYYFLGGSHVDRFSPWIVVLGVLGPSTPLGINVVAVLSDCLRPLRAACMGGENGQLEESGQELQCLGGKHPVNYTSLILQHSGRTVISNVTHGAYGSPAPPVSLPKPAVRTADCLATPFARC